MAAYLILNLLFITFVVALLRSNFKIDFKVFVKVLAALLVLTAVFDSLIIYFDVVNYDESKLLGVKIWLTPIEDFFYSILACIAIPALWHYFEIKSKEKNHDRNS